MKLLYSEWKLRLWRKPRGTTYLKLPLYYCQCLANWRGDVSPCKSASAARWFLPVRVRHLTPHCSRNAACVRLPSRFVPSRLISFRPVLFRPMSCRVVRNAPRRIHHAYAKRGTTEWFVEIEGREGETQGELSMKHRVPHTWDIIPTVSSTQSDYR